MRLLTLIYFSVILSASVDSAALFRSNLNRIVRNSSNLVAKRKFSSNNNNDNNYNSENESLFNEAQFFVFGLSLGLMAHTKKHHNNQIKYIDRSQKDPLFLEYLSKQIEADNMTDYERLLKQCVNYRSEWYFGPIIGMLNAHIPPEKINQYVLILFKQSDCRPGLANAALGNSNLNPTMMRTLEKFAHLDLSNSQCQSLTTETI